MRLRRASALLHFGSQSLTECPGGELASSTSKEQDTEDDMKQPSQSDRSLYEPHPDEPTPQELARRSLGTTTAATVDVTPTGRFTVRDASGRRSPKQPLTVAWRVAEMRTVTKLCGYRPRKQHGGGRPRRGPRGGRPASRRGTGATRAGPSSDDDSPAHPDERRRHLLPFVRLGLIRHAAFPLGDAQGMTTPFGWRPGDPPVAEMVQTLRHEGWVIDDFGAREGHRVYRLVTLPCGTVIDRERAGAGR
ncbi:MAG: hypothetical protein JHC84_02070 [Solirubrobacteraceae bacterium]|nr:hypothetical protein [Solirubrobacteraceae bacterium]